MGILYDMKLMLLYNGTAFVSNVKPQDGKELIVEWHRSAHVFDGYLYVVNDWFHGSASTEYATQAMAAVAKSADVKRGGFPRFCVVLVIFRSSENKVRRRWRERAVLGMNIVWLDVFGGIFGEDFTVVRYL
jgi:hypothetical protein